MVWLSRMRKTMIKTVAVSEMRKLIKKSKYAASVPGIKAFVDEALKYIHKSMAMESKVKSVPLKMELESKSAKAAMDNGKK